MMYMNVNLLSRKVTRHNKHKGLNMLLKSVLEYPQKNNVITGQSNKSTVRLILIESDDFLADHDHSEFCVILKPVMGISYTCHDVIIHLRKKSQSNITIQNLQFNKIILS